MGLGAFALSPSLVAAAYNAYVEQSAGKRRILEPGDRIPLTGVDIQVIIFAGQPIAKKMKGKFDFLDLGDLTWNYGQKLVCPVNLIGTVDLYQTTHHGLDRSNSPQFIRAIQPKVVVMNNGPRKGGQTSVFETLRKSPVLEDIWQGHMALGTPKEINTDERMIANMEPTAECTGNLLELSVAPNGTYTMTNLRNGFSKSYRAQ